MTKVNYQKFENAVKDLAKHFKKHAGSFDFLNESDLKCFLYAKLICVKELRDLRPVKTYHAKKELNKNKWMLMSPVHTELIYSMKDSSKKKLKRCDLAILDAKETGFILKKSQRRTILNLTTLNLMNN